MKSNGFNQVWVGLVGVFMLLVFQCAAENSPDVILSADTSCGNPRLLFTLSDVPMLRQKTQSGWLSEIKSAMIVQAESALQGPIMKYGGEGFEYGIQQQVLSSAMAGYITGDKKYIDNAITILCSQVANSEPNLTYFIKPLYIGVTAHTYSVGYDWLAPFMTQDQRDTVKAEIEKFGQWIYTASQSEFWGLDEPSRYAQNWNGVCHGGLGLSALILNDHDDWLNLAVRRAERYLENSVDATGAPWEGLSYNGYGMRNLTPMIAAYEKVSGRNLFDGSSRMRLLPSFLLYTMFPWGGGFVPICQTNDSYVEPGGMFYVINRYHDRTALWGWLKVMELDGPKEKRRQYGLLHSIHPYIILWADPTLKPLAPEGADFPLNKTFARGTVCMKDGWDVNGTLVTFTAGSGIQSIWNHADICSFTLSSGNERFAIELGYGKWKSAEHNIVLVDDAGYRPDGRSYSVKGSLVDFQEDGDIAVVCGDSQESYPQPFLKSKRTMLYKKENHPYLLIVDDIQKDPSTHHYSWQMYTPAENTVDINQHNFVITGSVGGQKCFGQFLWPVEAKLQFLPRADVTEKGGRVTASSKITCNVDAMNPHFLTLLAWKENELPKVTTQGTPADGMEIEILFADGKKDSIRVQGHQIQYKKIDTEKAGELTGRD